MVLLFSSNSLCQRPPSSSSFCYYFLGIISWLTDKRGHLRQVGLMPIYLFGSPYLSVPRASRHFQ